MRKFKEEFKRRKKRGKNVEKMWKKRRKKKRKKWRKKGENKWERKKNQFSKWSYSVFRWVKQVKFGGWAVRCRRVQSTLNRLKEIEKYCASKKSFTFFGVIIPNRDRTHRKISMRAFQIWSQFFSSLASHDQKLWVRRLCYFVIEHLLYMYMHVYCNSHQKISRALLTFRAPRTHKNLCKNFWQPWWSPGLDIHRFFRIWTWITHDPLAKKKFFKSSNQRKF